MVGDVWLNSLSRRVSNEWFVPFCILRREIPHSTRGAINIEAIYLFTWNTFEPVNNINNCNSDGELIIKNASL